MKKVIPLLLTICLTPFLSYGQEEAKISSPQTRPGLNGAPPRISHQELTQQAIRDRVRIYRDQHYERMPYLDRRLIQEIVTPEEIRQKIVFTSSAPQKKLAEVLTQAVKTHTPAKAAWERIALSRRRILAALRNLFPEAGYEFSDKQGVLSALEYNSFSYRAKFKQPVYRGGVLWNTLLQEKAELEAAQNNFDDVIGDVIKDVAQAYFEFHRTRLTALDQQAILESLRRLRDISEKKFKEGLISEIEHLNAQSLYGQIEYEYETTKQELELAKLELQKFLNLDMKDDFDIMPLYGTEDLLALEVSQEGPQGTSNEKREVFRLMSESPRFKLDELVDMGYRNRPELRVEAARLEAARLGQKIKNAKFLPEVDVSLEFGKTGEWFVVVPETDLKRDFKLLVEFKWNIGGNRVGYTFENEERAPSVTEFSRQAGTQQSNNKFSAGIFDGLNDLVEAKESQVKKLEQVIELEKAEKQVILDIKKAFFDFQKAQIQLRSSLQRAQYLKRRSELTRHRLGKNEIEISEYFEAEKSYMAELGSMHKAVADFLKARASVNHAVGDPHFLKFGEDA